MPKTRRNKKDGSCPMLSGGKRKTEGKRKTGGKRGKTRKLSKGASNWKNFVMKVHKERKAKDSSAKFSDTLKEASKRKAAGEY